MAAAALAYSGTAHRVAPVQNYGHRHIDFGLVDMAVAVRWVTAHLDEVDPIEAAAEAILGQGVAVRS